MARWSSKFERLARDRQCRDPELYHVAFQDPACLFGHAWHNLSRAGYKLYIRPKTALKISRMTTTWIPPFKRVALSYEWRHRPMWRKARTLVHECVHKRQDKAYRAFGIRYLMSPCFRLAMEIQAYRESVAAMVVMDINTRSYILETAQRLKRVYLSRRVKGLTARDIEDLLFEAKHEAEELTRSWSAPLQ